MRKLTTFLMTLLAGFVSYANADSSGTEITFEAGYRQDNLDFSIQVPSCDPLFKTTTRFKDVDIFQLGFRARTNLGCNFYVRGQFSLGWILDGKYNENSKVFIDETFFGSVIDDVVIESGTCNTIDGRYTVDFLAAIGYPFYFCDCTMFLAPVVGYAFDEQNLKVDDNHRADLTEVDSIFIPTSGSINNATHSKFVSRWYGPFIGLDFSYRPCNECWGIWAELEYHYARFSAKKHELGGVDLFNCFDKTSRNGHGWVFAAGAEYAFCGCWTVGFDAKYQDFRSTKRHRLCSDDEFESIFGSVSGDNHFRTHESWRSFAFSGTLGRSF